MIFIFAFWNYREPQTESCFLLCFPSALMVPHQAPAGTRGQWFRPEFKGYIGVFVGVMWGFYRGSMSGILGLHGRGSIACGTGRRRKQVDSRDKWGSNMTYRG